MDVIRGTLTQQDYDNASALNASCDCILGQSLQRQGFSRSEMVLGMKWHTIEAKEYEADDETADIIVAWYWEGQDVTNRLPHDFTLSKTFGGDFD